MRRALLSLAPLIGGLLAATFLTVPALAQGEGSLPQGAIYLTDTLRVDAGESLIVGPNTSVTGPGRIVVLGRLLVDGVTGAPAEFSVPIQVVGGGSVEMRHARLWGVEGAALDVAEGSARLEDVLVEGNARGANATGRSVLVIERAVFRDHAGEALYVEGSANVTIANTTFNGNGRGATVYSASRFHVVGSTFLANGQHLVVDLGPWSTAAPDLALTGVRFGAPAATPARLPSILLRYDNPLSEDPRRTVRMDSNVIEGAAVGLRAEGRGLVVESVDDTFVDNEVGLSVQLSTIRLERATLGNTRDIEGSGRVTLGSVTYLRGEETAPAPVAPATWSWWILGAAIAALAGAAVLAPRLRRPRAPRHAGLRALGPAPPPRDAPRTPDLRTPITGIERRILADVIAHPDTPQRAVADRLGYTRQALHYHVKKLEARGLVTKLVEGRETRCRVPPGVASMLSTAGETHTDSQEKG